MSALVRPWVVTLGVGLWRRAAGPPAATVVTGGAERLALQDWYGWMLGRRGHAQRT